jgi:hypothetical protein
MEAGLISSPTSCAPRDSALGKACLAEIRYSTFTSHYHGALRPVPLQGLKIIVHYFSRGIQEGHELKKKRDVDLIVK